MILIGGPTASGKTAVAAALCHEIGGEIISADSMQIYKGMDIGTAKVRDIDLGVRQHLIDVVGPRKAFSVVDYREKAVLAIRDIESREKVPVAAGGTGFYISSLLTEYGYGGEEDPSVRIALQNELKESGAAKLHEKLASLDPVGAAKIHPNNAVRVLRALEVCLVSGKPFSDQQNIRKCPVSPYTLFVLQIPDRAKLRERIDARVDTMIGSGLENEVKTLIDREELDFGMQSMRGIGYKEWAPRFCGQSASVEDVANAIKANTRAYAKRQQTWFAHQYADAVFLDASEPLETLTAKIVEYSNLNHYE